MLAQSPERDRDIEALQTMIRNCAAAGIPCVKYNMSILGVLRLPAARPAAATHLQHVAAGGCAPRIRR